MLLCLIYILYLIVLFMQIIASTFKITFQNKYSDKLSCTLSNLSCGKLFQYFYKSYFVLTVLLAFIYLNRLTVR